MITKRKLGSNITLINTIYYREFIQKEESRDLVEHLDIVYKDCDTGEKYIEEIINPDYQYHMLLPDKVKDYAQFFVPEGDCVECTTPNKELLKQLAKDTNNLEFFYNNIKTGNRSENMKLHTHPMILGSDRHIEDHYRERFNDEYINLPCSISKSFIDIEVDTKDIDYEFPQSGQCPINAVSVIIQETKHVYSFLLRDPENPLIEKFENEIKSGSVFSRIKDFIINAIGGLEIAEKYDLMNIEVSFLFYDKDKEIDLIAGIFGLINSQKPDFILAWNMAFDIPYIIDRIKVLGYDPAEIMSHPDFKFKHCEYFVDHTDNFNELAERGDNACITSYTVFLDQMIHFASRRKGGEKFLNYKLDYIGEQVAGVKKLDYKNITQILGELPYLDYETFVFYNIMDTIVQYCIEFNTQDIEYVFTKSNLNNTRYHKCHRQTVYLTNRAAREFKKQGFIMGNNLNRFNPKPEEKFPGAFVADPLLVNDYSKVKLNGSPIMVYNNLMDFDYASLYPSVYREFNIAPNTLIGMVIIGMQIHNKENKCKDSKWTRASAYMEDLQSHVWMEFCARWLNFPRYETLYNDVIEYFTCHKIPHNGCLRKYDKNGLINPIIFDVPLLTKEGLIKPIIKDSERRLISPIIYGEDDDYDHNEKPVVQMNLKEVEEVLIKLTEKPNQIFRV